MKRFFLVAAAVGLLAGLGSPVGAQSMCLYPNGGCWPDGPAKCNESWGWVFDGGEQGAGTYCAGGTYNKDATTNKKGEAPPTGARPILGCCLWASSGVYDNVYTTENATYCAGGANTWWKDKECGEEDADGNLSRPSGTPTYDGSSNTPEDWVTCSGDNSGYCKWETGCKNISTCTGGDPGSDCASAASTCAQAVENCLTDSETKTVYSDANCSVPKTSGGNGGGDTPTPSGGHCKVNGQLAFCGYAPYGDGAGGCYKIENQYSNTDKTCDELITSCTGNSGTIYTGSSVPPILNTDPYGDGESCSALGLTSTGGNSVKLVGSKAVTQGLKVSYAKNRVTVNWTPAAKVSSGTVQLINMKGAAVSTAFIKANSSKVTAKLGTVGVPAGMYFVHINAVGQNGKKIVSQSAVSIVK